MFDEISKEPEDVFAQTDASAPQMASPTMNAPAQPVVVPAPVVSSMAPSSMQTSPSPSEGEGASDMSEKRPFPWKLVVLFVAIVAVVGLAFFLSMKILNSRTPVTPTAPVETTQPVVAEEAPVPTPIVEEVVPAPVEDQTIDTDKDGLTDIREAQLGTNPNLPDTDADELFDKEEVDVYQTNPLNPDTDGDTFKDGVEVKGGYNPSGPGKLLQIPQK